MQCESVCGLECLQQQQKKGNKKRLSWRWAPVSDGPPVFLNPGDQTQTPLCKNKTWMQNQSPASAQSLWLPLPNTNNHFPPFLFSPLCETLLPLIGLFKLLAHHLSNGGWQRCPGEGERGPPRWERGDARRGDEARTPPRHITRRRRPINSHNGHISAHALSRLPPLFHFVFVPWRHVWRRAGCSDLEDVTLFCCETRGGTHGVDARRSKLRTAVNAPVKPPRGGEQIQKWEEE